MSEDLSEIRKDIGNLRETVGELRGAVIATKDLLQRVEIKVDDYQRINKSTHASMNSRVSNLQMEIERAQAKSQVKDRMADWGRSLATGSVAAAAFTWVLQWIQNR